MKSVLRQHRQDAAFSTGAVGVAWNGREERSAASLRFGIFSAGGAGMRRKARFAAAAAGRSVCGSAADAAWGGI
ncbi:hypothetical protein NM961_07075 [Tahibacter sp. P2K]|uniref:Uncharacterized protein n=1 Tax=Tahibacter harae TaxID=2963937 RepID=A0ABT1QQC1_9GAMM|nr:hypothetical protein [Tahibacter harae]